MISFDDSPEGNCCKYIATKGEGMRGFLLSINEDKTEGVVLSFQDSFEGDVKFGKLYLIIEMNPEQYPMQHKEVRSIPRNHVILNLRAEQESDIEVTS